VPASGIQSSFCTDVQPVHIDIAGVQGQSPCHEVDSWNMPFRGIDNSN
jgi:hypothetical protein